MNVKILLSVIFECLVRASSSDLLSHPNGIDSKFLKREDFKVIYDALRNINKKFEYYPEVIIKACAKTTAFNTNILNIERSIASNEEDPVSSLISKFFSELETNKIKDWELAFGV